MPLYLHVFAVSKNSERFVAYEFHANSGESHPSFDIELIVWGMDKDQDLRSTVELLVSRGWKLEEISAAIKRARNHVDKALY